MTKMKKFLQISRHGLYCLNHSSVIRENTHLPVNVQYVSRPYDRVREEQILKNGMESKM